MKSGEGTLRNMRRRQLHNFQQSKQQKRSKRWPSSTTFEHAHRSAQSCHDQCQAYTIYNHKPRQPQVLREHSSKLERRHQRPQSGAAPCNTCAAIGRTRASLSSCFCCFVQWFDVCPQWPPSPTGIPVASCTQIDSAIHANTHQDVMRGVFCGKAKQVRPNHHQ